MNSLYFQLIGGASADMILSSLISLGCPLSYLVRELKKLRINFKIKMKSLKLKHFSVKKLHFEGDLDLSYREIIKAIENSKLDKDIKEKAISAYRNIFEVEKKIHKIKKWDFKFHHLGKLDAILEVCGFFLALKYLNVEKVYSSVFPLDSASLATLELLKDKEIKVVNFGYETITPTASLLLKDALQKDVNFRYKKYAVGFGDYGEEDYLIVYLFEEETFNKDRIIKIEVNIDDMSPEFFEQIFEKLYKFGAKEVYLEQVLMKKNRPAFLLNVLCEEKNFDKLKDLIFSYTSTFGLRYQFYFRDKLSYKFVSKKTKFGKIKFRVSTSSKFKKEKPEYENCLKIASKNKLPLIEIYRSIREV